MHDAGEAHTPRRINQKTARDRNQRPGNRAGVEPFQITINLGSDVLQFDKSIAPDPNDVTPSTTLMLRRRGCLR